MKNIIIITGFMGTGKTTAGRKVAETLGWQFYDMDFIIEEQEGLRIPDIFKKKGQEYFRQRESEALLFLCQAPHTVIATGGGTLLVESNREMALNEGIVFCLTASIDVLYDRLKNSNHRPLLELENLRSKMLKLLQARESVYRTFPHQIDTSALSPDKVTQKILREYQQTVNENRS